MQRVDWRGRKQGREPTGEDKADPNSGPEAEYAPGSGGGRAAGREGLEEREFGKCNPGWGRGVLGLSRKQPLRRGR